MENKKNDSVWILKMFRNNKEEYLLTWVVYILGVDFYQDQTDISGSSRFNLY